MVFERKFSDVHFYAKVANGSSSVLSKASKTDFGMAEQVILDERRVEPIRRAL